jgi:hypothetical protein
VVRDANGHVVRDLKAHPDVVRICRRNDFLKGRRAMRAMALTFWAKMGR